MFGSNKMNCSERSARMLHQQKEELLRLIKMYFIRTVGKWHNVNDKEIGMDTWSEFAEQLNKWGPTKSAVEWKYSFYYMKLRVKSKFDRMLKTCKQIGESLDIHKFSEIDAKIVNMFYMESNLGIEEPNENQIDINTQMIANSDQDKPNENAEPLITETRQVDKETRVTHITSLYGISISEFIDPSSLEALEHDIEQQQRTDVNKQMIANSAPDKTNEESEPLITETRQVAKDTRVTHITSLYGSSISEFTEFIDPALEPDIEQQQYDVCGQFAQYTTSNQNRNVIRKKQLVRRIFRPARGMRTESRRVIRRRQPLSRVRRIVRNPSGKHSANDQRVSENQKTLLLDLVEKNFLRTVGRFSGLNGVVIKRRLWEQNSIELNALGPAFKSPKGWEKTFTSIRLQTKRNLAKMRKERNKSEGKKNVAAKLSKIDYRILRMFGIDILDGQQKLGEGGFAYEKTMLSFGNAHSSSTVPIYSNENEVESSQDCSQVFPTKIAQMSQNSNETEVDRFNVRAKIIVLSDEIIKPNHDWLSELHQVPVTTPPIELKKLSSEREQLSRDTSVNVTLSQADMESGQSSHRQEPSLQIDESDEPHTHIKPASFERGQSSRDTSINVHLSQARNDQKSSYNQSLRQKQATKPTANQTKKAPISEAQASSSRTARRNVSIDGDDRNGNINRHRNRHTSYEMVERSINNQERFINESEKNHNEILSFLARSLNEFSSILRDFLNRNN